MAKPIKIKGGPNYGVNLSEVSTKDEMILNTDTGYFKIGDGVSSWSAVPEYGKDGKGVRINAATGNWMLWDGTAWQDTGHDAKTIFNDNGTIKDFFEGETIIQNANAGPTIPNDKHVIRIYAAAGLTAILPHVVANQYAPYKGYKIYITAPTNVVSMTVNMPSVWLCDQAPFNILGGDTALIEVDFSAATTAGTKVAQAIVHYQPVADVAFKDMIGTLGNIRTTNFNISTDHNVNSQVLDAQYGSPWLEASEYGDILLIDEKTVFVFGQELFDIDDYTSTPLYITGDAEYDRGKSGYRGGRHILMPDMKRLFYYQDSTATSPAYFGFLDTTTWYMTTIHPQGNIDMSDRKFVDHCCMYNDAYGSWVIHLIDHHGITPDESSHVSGNSGVLTYIVDTNTFVDNHAPVGGVRPTIKIFPIDKSGRYLFAIRFKGLPGYDDMIRIPTNYLDGMVYDTISGEEILTCTIDTNIVYDIGDPIVLNGATPATTTGIVEGAIHYAISVPNVGRQIFLVNTDGSTIDTTNYSTDNYSTGMQSLGQTPFYDVIIGGNYRDNILNYWPDAYSYYQGGDFGCIHTVTTQITSQLMLPDGRMLMVDGKNGEGHYTMQVFPPENIVVKPGIYALMPLINKTC